jgi:polyisoprenoid-binding protein YceI
MNRVASLFASTIVLTFALTTAVPAATFKVDPVHSFVVFKISHLDLGYVWGEFNGPAGTIAIDDSDASKSSVQIEVKADSIFTNAAGRDKHLKGPDFFDVKQFPTITFKSTSFKKSGDNAYEVTGDLTLHGVTKPLTVTLTKLGEADKGAPLGYRGGFEANFTIKRSDFGMNTMLNAAGDEVKLMVDLEGVKQ